MDVKRRARAGLLCMFLLLVTACGGEAGTDADAEGTAEEGDGQAEGAPALPDPDSTGELLPDTVTADRPYRVGFSFPQIEIPFFVNVSYGAAQECERLGIECLFTFGGGYDRPEVQVQDIEELLGQGVDALAISPADDVSLVPVLQPAVDQGVVVTSFAGLISGLDYYGFEGVSHYEKGEAFTNAVVDCLQEKGLEEAELLGIGAAQGVGSYTPVEQAYEDILGTGDAAGYEMVYHQYTNETREEAIRVTEDALSAYPDPDGILPGAPEIGQGVIQVLRGRGFQPGDVCLSTGGGWDSASEAAIREGWYYNMTVQQAVVTGQQNIRKVVAHLNGDDVPFYIPEPLLIVSADDIDDLDLETLIAPEGYTPVSRVEPTG
jgi:ABC-type sugar transport system substrate-binding protein